MKPRDVFGIIIRAFGLMMAGYAVWYLAYGVAQLAGLPQDRPAEMIQFFISSGVMALVGIYLLRGAPHVVSFSYPPERKDEVRGPDV